MRPIVPEVKKAVLDYAAHFAGVSASTIELGDRVEEKFRITGRDTIRFYEGFFKEFPVENLNDFHIDNYYSREVWEYFALSLKSPFSKKAREALKMYDVSIGHLVKVAQEKRWTNPTVEQELKLEDHQFAVAHSQASTGIILKVDMTLYIGEGDRYFVFDTQGEAIEYMTRTIEEDPEIECFMVNANKEVVMCLDKNGTRRFNDG